MLALVLALVAGCASIPDASAPTPIETFGRSRPVNLVPVPRGDADPESVARDFLKAMADPDTGHRAARKFMTSRSSKSWDDQGALTILDNVGVIVDERSESAVRLRVTGEVIGALSENGQLTPATGETSIPLALVRSGDTWKISGDLLPAAVTDRAQFEAVYRSASLFFPNRDGTALIADPRWFFGTAADPTVLVNSLLGGPAADLGGATTSVAPAQTSVKGSVVTTDDTVTIDLLDLPDTDARNRTALAASIVWTLDSAGVRGTYVINADGGPLLADRVGGWRTADVKAFDPKSDSRYSDVLHVLREGGLYRVGDSGTSPVAGGLGGARDLRAAAVSRDLSTVAVVAERPGRQTLSIGAYGSAVTEIAAGRAVSSPSFGRTANIGFAVIDGQLMQWTRDDSGNIGTANVDTAAVTTLVPGPITALRVSPDGVRVALIVRGEVLLGVLSTSDRGTPALTGVHRVAYDTDSPAVAISWGSAAQVYIARSGSEQPAERFDLSGLPPTALVAGNLKPPLAALAATETSVFVTDRQGVLQLRVAGVRPSQYWTVVVSGDDHTLPVSP